MNPFLWPVPVNVIQDQTRELETAKTETYSIVVDEKNSSTSDWNRCMTGEEQVLSSRM
jgi:hypothetical protein